MKSLTRHLRPCRWSPRWRSCWLRVNSQRARRCIHAEQAAAGRTAYEASCASCHVADLGGRTKRPSWPAADFMNTWRTRTTKDLFEFIRRRCRRAVPRLPPEQYLSIASYILQQNGAAAGAQPLTPATAVADRHGRHRSASRGRRGCRSGRGAAPARGEDRAPAAAGKAPAARRRAAAAIRGWTGSRWPRTGGGDAARAHRDRRSEELRAGHRRDAAQSAARATG